GRGAVRRRLRAVRGEPLLVVDPRLAPPRTAIEAIALVGGEHRPALLAGVALASQDGQVDRLSRIVLLCPCHCRVLLLRLLQRRGGRLDAYVRARWIPDEEDLVRAGLGFDLQGIDQPSARRHHLAPTASHPKEYEFLLVDLRLVCDRSRHLGAEAAVLQAGRADVERRQALWSLSLGRTDGHLRVLGCGSG